VCSTDSTIACRNNAECAGAGDLCKHVGTLVPRPDQCTTACEDTGDGVNGQCDADGPDNKGCDGLVRANGEGFFQCLSNADCAEANIGIDAGNCTLVKRQPCFLPTIVAEGDADPETPLGVGIFCIPQTGNGGINGVAGLPGPARVLNHGVVEHQCTNGAYVPGVGCP